MRVGDIGLKTFAFRLEPNFVPIRLMSAIVYAFLQKMIRAKSFLLVFVCYEEWCQKTTL